MYQKFLSVSILLLSAIFVFTSLSDDKSDYALADEAFVVGNNPVLPDQPYDYDIQFPAHIAQGGVWNQLDTADLNRKINPDGATLGRVLFYDKKLSFNNQISCASCHIQEHAFADNVQFSEGFEDRLSFRNSPNLNDLGWASSNFSNQNHLLFWDNRESDLDLMTLSPIQHADELGKDLDYMVQKLGLIYYYPELFEKAFGDNAVTAERVGNALAQFIRSMSVFDSKFDKVKNNEASFTAAEAAGFDLFRRNCDNACHSEPNFSTSMALNNGLDEVFEDEGMGGWTGNAGDIGKFKSPSLRNIEFTAPYMHDGRFNTLEDVMDYYSEDVNDHPNSDFHWVGQGNNFTGFRFTDTEKEQMIAFMKTLSSADLLTDEKWSDPFAKTSDTEDEMLKAAIQVYPNPVRESFTLDLGGLANQEVDLNLMDMSGKLVWSNQTTGGSQQTFEVGKLTSGVYLLRMNIEGQQVSKKLLFK